MNQEVMRLSAGQNHIVLPLLPMDAGWYQPGEGLLHHYSHCLYQPVQGVESGWSAWSEQYVV